MNKSLVLLLVIVLLTVSVSAQEGEWELTETWEIAPFVLFDIGFNIDYPAGWFAETRTGPVTVFNELEVDHQGVFNPTTWETDAFATQGYSISIVFLTGRILSGFGLPAAGTLNDWLEFNSTAFGYEDPIEVSETSLFTWPALQVRTVDGMGNHILAIQSFYGQDGFLFTLAAPSAEALDAFLPTWEAMLTSIQVFKGRIVIDDRELYLSCAGSGSPTVILEPNVDNNHLMWGDAALRVIGEYTRVCVHKRSAPGDDLRTIQNDADDTHDLLVMVGVEGPYVLVGPYVGGYFVMVYADTYPDEVAGVVLVDSFHPDSVTREFELRAELEGLSAEEIETKLEEGITSWASLGLDYEASIAQVAAVDSLGDLPLVVLSPEIWGLPEEPISEEWHRIWVEEFQPDLAALSTNSTLIIIEGAGHGNVLQQREIYDAIQQMVEEVRAQGE